MNYIINIKSISNIGLIADRNNDEHGAFYNYRAGFIDNKVKYRIFLKDEYSYLIETIALHLVLLDRARGRNEAFKGERFDCVYSYSAANKLYNANWVLRNFEHSKIFDDSFFKPKPLIRKDMPLAGKLCLVSVVLTMLTWIIIGIVFLAKYGGIL